METKDTTRVLEINDSDNKLLLETVDAINGYLVSNKGRIKSFKHRKAKLLTAFANNKGYPRVALCKDG